MTQIPPFYQSPLSTASTTQSTLSTTNDFFSQIRTQIDSFISSGKFQELSLFLNSLQGVDRNLVSNLLTSIISEVIETNQNVQLIKILLSHGADVNTIIHCQDIKEEDGITLLMYSIMIKNVELFKCVLSFGPDILITDAENQNAVVTSILLNEDKDVFFLEQLLKLNHSAVHTEVTIENETHNLLTLATDKNKPTYVALLLTHGIDVNYAAKPSLDTAMHIAVKNDYLEIAEQLYKHERYDHNRLNKEMKTPKDIACELKAKVYNTLFINERDDTLQQQLNSHLQFQQQLNMHSNSGNNVVNAYSGPNNINNAIRMQNTPMQQLMSSSSQGNPGVNGVGAGASQNVVNANLNVQSTLGSAGQNNNLIITQGVNATATPSSGRVNNKGVSNSIGIGMRRKNNFLLKKNLKIPIELPKQKMAISNIYIDINKANPKLCVNINKTPEQLSDEMEKMKKQLEEKVKALRNYEMLLNDVSAYVYTYINSLLEKKSNQNAEGTNRNEGLEDSEVQNERNKPATRHH